MTNLEAIKQLKELKCNKDGYEAYTQTNNNIGFWNA